MENTNQPSKVLKWALIIGMVIVINLFFNYALSVLYKSPDYENFCKQTQVVEPLQTKDACLSAGGQWNQYIQPDQIVLDQKGAPIQDSKMVAHCDQNYTCQKDFELARKNYERNVFITLVILGVLILGLSFIFTKNDAIAYGLSLGGVLSFIIASMRYWASADDWLKVIILGIALIALIALAYKKFSNK